MVTILLVAHLATWYINLLTNETLIFVLSFQIANTILEVHNFGPNFLLTRVSSKRGNGYELRIDLDGL